MWATARVQILERMEPDENILLRGVANIGRSMGYYVVSERGVHYTDREKVGLLRKREVSGFIACEDIASMYVEQFRNLPEYAYLRIYGHSGECIASIWFEDEFGDEPAEMQAHRMANALGAV
jgi:hypothetical protein